MSLATHTHTQRWVHTYT